MIRSPCLRSTIIRQHTLRKHTSFSAGYQSARNYRQPRVANSAQLVPAVGSLGKAFAGGRLVYPTETQAAVTQCPSISRQRAPEESVNEIDVSFPAVCRVRDDASQASERGCGGPSKQEALGGGCGCLSEERPAAEPSSRAPPPRCLLRSAALCSTRAARSMAPSRRGRPVV